jgi:hypothetical protein
MKDINLSDEDIQNLQRLKIEFDELYEVNTWTIDDLDGFREIGTEFISILSKYLN